MRQPLKNWQIWLIALALFGFISALMIVPSYQLLVKPRGQSFDFFWLWSGGRAVLNGQNPYGEETTRSIQLGVYRQIIPPDQYQHRFPLPAHLAIVLLPFMVVPFSWAILAWLALQIPLLMLTLLGGLSLLRWQVRPIFLALLIFLTSLGFRYPIIVYVLGQVVIFVLFCLIGSAWLYRQGHPRLAALLLAGATIRPDIALVALGAALVLSRESPQRRPFITTLLASGLLLLITPILLTGDLWPVTWLNTVFIYGSDNPNATWPPALLASPWLIAAGLAGLTLWSGRYVKAAWQQPSLYRHSLMISALTLFNVLLMPQTGAYTLTLTLIPAVILLRYAAWPWLRTLIAASLLLPWLYFWWGEPAQTLIFLLIPLQFILFQTLITVWPVQRRA